MTTFAHSIASKFLSWRDAVWTEKLVTHVPWIETDDSDTLVVFCHARSSYYAALYLLIAHGLARRGVASCFLFENDWGERCFPDLIIDGEQLSNSLSVDVAKTSISCGRERARRFDWVFDLAGERIEADGLNLFFLIRNTLRARHRRYNIDFSAPEIVEACTCMTDTCDLLFHYFMLMKKLAGEKKTAIKIAAWELDYLPSGVFRLLCEQFSEDGDVEYLDLARGYPHYFGHHYRDSYVGIANITRTKAADRLVIGKEELASFAERGDDRDVLLESVNKALNPTREFSASPRKAEIIDLTRGYRERGRSVFVLLAHVFYDTPVLDESPSYPGMCDWIVDTIRFFKGRDDLLLLKPHPGEFWVNEPEKEPTETLADFLGDMVDADDNIVMLEPRLFRINDLHPHLTCGLVWRSSVALELTYLRVPCIIAGTPPYRSLDLTYAKDRDDYFSLIEGAGELRVGDEESLNAARYIYCMEMDKQVRVDCLYCDHSSGLNHWAAKGLKRYLARGNEAIDMIIDKVLE